MALRRKSSDDDGVSIDRAGSEPILHTRGDVQLGDDTRNPILDAMLAYPTSHLDPALAMACAGYLEGFRGTFDKTVEFVAGATAGRYLRRGAVGVLETARHDAYYEHLMEVRDQTAFRGRGLRVAAGVGALYPVRLFDIAAGVGWLREHDSETYHRLAKDGMRQPGDLFDGALRAGPHLLLANADIRGLAASEHTSIARYILKQHVGLGCSVILTVTDEDTYKSGQLPHILKGLSHFYLGSF